MTYKLELYYFNECPYCQIVLRKIQQLNIQNVVMKNIREDQEALNKLVNDTGRKTVPCMYINDKPMHESSDIANWLEENKDKLS